MSAAPVKGTLLVGSLPRIMVPVARSLHARGIPVHGASVGFAANLHSRAMRSFTALGSPDQDPDAFFDTLRRVIESHAIDTVMPCGDEALRALAPFDAALRQIVTYCGPSKEACRLILEKRETLAIASDVGIPVPREYQIQDADALQAMRAELIFPVVVKPKNKEAEAITAIKSEIAYTFDDLSKYFDRYPEFGRWFLIQDYVPGSGVAVAILMDEDSPVCVFQHRRLREYPVRGGVSVAAVSEVVDPQILDYSVALLRAMKWQGVAMVEYRYDSHSRRLALMEVNGRFWGSVSLALSCGVDFPWYVWCLAHGRELPVRKPYRAGRRFRWLAGDIKRTYECFAAQAGRGEALKHLIGDSPPGAADSLWAWRDPVPAIEEAARATVSVALMITGAGLRRTIPPTVYRRAKSLRHAGLRHTMRYLGYKFFSRPGGTFGRTQVDSVAFICHGNIIRSAIAEALFRSQSPGVEVASAGVAAIPGSEADARAAEVAHEFGVTLSGHRAKPVSAEIVDSADLLLVMDYSNYARVLDAFPEAKNKVALLSAVMGRATEIDDPFEGDTNDIRTTFKEVQSYTSKLVTLLSRAT